MNPDAFLAIVRNYKLLPAGAENIVALSLPWIEFILGSFLILGFLVRQSAIAVSFLLLVFIVAILVNTLRGVNFSCGCFSLSLEKTNRTSAIWWIIRDIGLIFSGLTLVICQRAYVYIKRH